MSDHWISLFSVAISFAGLMLVVRQLRDNTKQQESASLVEINDLNQRLISLGFSHPQLFAILHDAKDADPLWEQHYLQLWLNQMLLIHTYLRRSALEAELKEGLLGDFAHLAGHENFQRHWRKCASVYPKSFQTLIDSLIDEKSRQ
jgi:hypothetical protein